MKSDNAVTLEFRSQGLRNLQFNVFQLELGPGELASEVSVNVQANPHPESNDLFDVVLQVNVSTTLLEERVFEFNLYYGAWVKC